MRVLLTRDSVCMADDIEAPHDLAIDIPEGCTVRELLATVIRYSYLASVGGKATWTAHALGGPVAVISQQWEEPQFVMDPERRCEGSVEMDFSYWAERSPDDVFAQMKAFAASRVPSANASGS